MGFNQKPDIHADNFGPGLGQSFSTPITPSLGKRIVIVGGEASVNSAGIVDININGKKIGPGYLPANGGSKLATQGPISGLIDEEVTIDVVTSVDCLVRIYTVESD